MAFIDWKNKAQGGIPEEMAGYSSFATLSSEAITLKQ
jgi:hypothetical protein